jgi:hypothetical protein
MSALTYEIKDPRSPVALWLRARFPHHKEIQAAYRVAAGPARLLPPAEVLPGTQGAAIDWWLRFLLDPAPSLDLPLAGLQIRDDLPCCNAGLELLTEVGVIDGRATKVRAMDPARFAHQPDQWWARLSYALALLVELYRAPSVEGSRLMRLTPRSTASDLLALANDAEVTDLIAMRDLAAVELLPALPAGPVATGMTFEGSRHLNADADLIAGGTLVDFKASQGRSPRKDGTRAAALARSDLDQLLGYALMDYSDTYKLDTVAIYAVRFGHYSPWPIEGLGEQLAGHRIDLPALRKEFAHVLKVELPAYHRTQT